MKNFFVSLLALLGFFIARITPRPWGLRLFGALGRIVFLFPNIEKTRTLEHLRLVFGKEWSEEKIAATARNVYVSLGKNMFDAVKLSRSTDAVFHRLVKHDDLADFKAAYDRGRGIIVITAHVGCFEMLLHFFARHGFKSFAIGRRMFDARLENLVRSVRSGENIDYLGRDEGSLKMIRRLREGRVFGVLIDQDIRVVSVHADFLGIPAHTPSGPLKIAMKYNIPAVVATTARQPDDTHYVYLSRVLDLADTGDFEADLVTNVGKANDLICRTIRRFPEQWVWMHRRWKRPPPEGK